MWAMRKVSCVCCGSVGKDLQNKVATTTTHIKSILNKQNIAVLGSC